MSKFNSVTSGPSLNTYTPPDAASALEAAQRLVIEYWKAGTWQEKLKLVSKPERVAALMRTFYEKQEGHDLQGRVLRAHAFRRNGSTEILTLTYEAETSATDPAVTLNLVRQSDGSWLLDWDLSASGRSTVSR